MSATHQQAQARAENERAITEMCSLARQPERAAAFIASGKDRMAVLTELRADQASGRAPDQRGSAAASLASMRRELARSGSGHDVGEGRAGGANAAMTSMERELARQGLATKGGSATMAADDDHEAQHPRRPQVRVILPDQVGRA